MYRLSNIAFAVYVSFNFIITHGIKSVKVKIMFLIKDVNGFDVSFSLGAWKF